MVKTAQRARKSAAGYDLTRLMVGAEGTLGVITELTVRLYGIPEMILSAVCPFQTLEGACNAVIQSMQLGLGVARMEVVDEAAIYAVNKYAKLGLEEAPTLFLEFHGTDVSRPQPGRAVPPDRRGRGRDPLRLGREGGGPPPAVEGAPRVLLGGEEHAGPARTRSRPTSACRSRGSPNAWWRRRRTSSRSGLIAPIAGHAGDGNFHTRRWSTAPTPRTWRPSKASWTRLTERAIRMEGTCTGEHGIGQGKAKYLKAELGDGLAVMRAIKQALDPLNIMNPGKIFPG